MRTVVLAAVLSLLSVSTGYGSSGGAVEASGSATLNSGGRGSVWSISCAARGECAAGGSYRLGQYGQYHEAFVVGETNGSWGNPVEVPGTATLNSGGNARVLSISCATAGECAAGGYYRDGRPPFYLYEAFVVSETNGSWGKAIEVPGTARLNHHDIARVTSISCAAAGECVAGGSYGGGGNYQAFVVSETNGSWGKAVEVPGTATLNSGGNARVLSISCAAAGECAAGGFYASGGSYQAFVVSETKGSWGKAIEVPGTARLNRQGITRVTSISCAAAGECAAGGYDDTGGNLQAFVVSETNGVWGSAVKLPAPPHGREAQVSSVSCAAAGECDAGGFYNSGSEAFVVSETNGSWGTAIEVPGTGGNGVDSISCAAAGECAASGSYNDDSGIAAFVVSETNGSWGTAIEVPGTAALNTDGDADANSVSCAAAGECAAGGYVTDGSGRHRAFVVGEANGSWGNAIQLRLPAACVVPNVVGKAISAAKKALKHADCGLGKITYVSSKSRKGSVVAQNPKAARSLSAGAKVALAVSVGRSDSLRRMAIVTKRNAVVGFVVLKVGKIVARKKAKKLKQKLPSRSKR